MRINWRVDQTISKLDRPKSLMVSGLMFTFSNESPGAEECLLEVQGGEALVFLEALVESPEPRWDGHVTKAKRSRGEHVWHRRIHGVVIARVWTDILVKHFLSHDLRNVVPHGYDLQEQQYKERIRISCWAELSCLVVMWKSLGGQTISTQTLLVNVTNK